MFLTSCQKAPTDLAERAKLVMSPISFQPLIKSVVLSNGFNPFANLLPAFTQKFFAVLILESDFNEVAILPIFLAVLNKAPGNFAKLFTVPVIPPRAAPGIAPTPPSRNPIPAPIRAPSTKPSVKIPTE